MGIDLGTLLRAALPVALGTQQGQYIRTQEDERKRKERESRERQRRQDEQQDVLFELRRQTEQERLRDMRAPPAAPTVRFNRGGLSGEVPVPEGMDAAAAALDFKTRYPDLFTEEPDPARTMTPYQSYQVGENTRRRTTDTAESWALAKAREGVPIVFTGRGAQRWLADEIAKRFPGLDEVTAYGMASAAIQQAEREGLQSSRSEQLLNRGQGGTDPELDPVLAALGGGAPAPAAPRPPAAPAVDPVLLEARASVQGMDPQAARALLEQSGFSPAEIAQILGG